MNSKKRDDSGIANEGAAPWRLVAAVGLCGLLAIGALARWAGVSMVSETAHVTPARSAARGDRLPLVVACRDEPIRIAPAFTMRDAVSEQDLVSLLCAALPWWNPPTVPSAIHELKLWGSDAVFTKEMLGIPRTGEWLTSTLLSDAACRANTTAIGGAFLLDSPFGIRVVLAGSDDAIKLRAEAHYGQLLQVLAEAGVPSTAPVTTSSGRVGTVKELYQDEVMRFSLSHEPEFMACSLAYWQPQRTMWKDQFDNEYNFDQLLLKMIRMPLGQGSCGGCHVPYAVVILLRVDEQQGILSNESRKEARNWLIKLQRLLEERWSESGGWDKSWAGETRNLWSDDILDRITITGHHLEWMALAPADLRPSLAMVQRATGSLRRDVASLPKLSNQVFKTLLPTSHAARALALLRGDQPFQVWQKYWQRGLLRRTDKGFELRQRAG